METTLLSEEEQTEYLDKRDAPLTKKQRNELRKIETAGVQLRYNLKVLEDYSRIDPYIGEMSEERFRNLRSMQREILTNERKSLLDRISSVQLKIKEWGVAIFLD